MTATGAAAARWFSDSATAGAAASAAAVGVTGGAVASVGEEQDYEVLAGLVSIYGDSESQEREEGEAGNQPIAELASWNWLQTVSEDFIRSYTLRFH